MEIIIVRQEHKPWGIDGHLYINRQRVCDTVEHPTCCRPQGEYQVALDNNPFRHGDGALSSIHGEIIVGKLACQCHLTVIESRTCLSVISLVSSGNSADRDRSLLNCKACRNFPECF